MFTGIVQGMATVVHIEKKSGLHTHTLQMPAALLQNLTIGGSVAHNGCCLTITQINGDNVTFDLMQETLSLTNLGNIQVGDRVNIERAATIGDEIGGHLMSGHITGQIEIVAIESSENNQTLWFELSPAYAKYILPKGFVGLDGCSLTIGQVTDSRFNVHLIPETLTKTLFGERNIGERVNLELDPNTQAIVDTVERVMQASVRA